MRKVEILAPAGSYESMQAAVNAGCDAVYIGGSQFGARAFADNLSVENLKKAMDFVHIRDKKLYLTVNTLLKEEELKEQLYDYLLPFYEHGLDAVIVQDIGVMSFIHKAFPELPIHASTQMSLTGSRGANGLKSLGVTRFVPARELSLEELRDIRRETDLEIETFVHGALCYCYSGQCLLSSMIGGRSGNRGRCAQPCRMQYRLPDGKTGYFMSPKDICTLDLIPELIDSGIDSFKIEGRMKRSEYAAFTSYLYGKYTDLYVALGREEYEGYLKKHRREFLEDKTALMDLYNRGGFSNGYYSQYHGKNMMSVKRPNHSGVQVGTTVRAGKRNAIIRLEKEVYGQDILEFRNNKELSVYEFTLKEGAQAGEELMVNILPGSRIYQGMSVFRTRNQRLLHKIGTDFMEKDVPVKIEGHFFAAPGEVIQLTFSCTRENGELVTVCVNGDVAEEAKSQPMTAEKIKKAIMQMQDSGFALENLKLDIKGDIFIPIGRLKELRREGLFKLMKALTAKWRRKAQIMDEERQFEGEPSKEEGFKIDASVLTKEQAKVVCASRADRIYLTAGLYQECSKSGIDFSKKEVIFTLPYVVREKNRNRVAESLAMAEKCKGFLVRNAEELFWVEDKKIILDSGMYVLNKEAEAAYKDFGATELTASVEQNCKELSKTGCQGKTLIVYGHVPLMITAQCMIDTVYGCQGREDFKELYDRKGKKLLLRNVCKDCYNIIYDGTPLSLLKEKDAVKGLAPERLRLDFTVETKEETERILNTFLDVFRFNQEGILEKETTKGHFRKGIE